MALETTEFDVANYITDPQDVFYHLRAELEENDPEFLAIMLAAVMRARGGVEAVSAESGISADAFAQIATMNDAELHDLATRLMEAYRPAVSSTKVA